MACRYAVWGLILSALMAATPVSAGTSAFQTAPPDSRAVTVAAKGDGRADDTQAIQHALDAATEHSAGGLVFLPSGRYRISHTLLLSPGVRLYGVGATRPVLLLGGHTPGFQHGVGSMVVFTGARRGDPVRTGPGPNEARVPFPPPTVVPFDPGVADANSSTFYSVMSNIDIEIGPGNPAATAVRFRVAQHAYLSNMDFHLGGAFAGIYQAGNFVQNLRFLGGRYGIVTEKTSPAWQFTVLDSSFEGQTGAAIREHEAGLTLVDVTLRNVPVGIEIDPGYGDSLWGKDVRFDAVRQAGVVISNEGTVYTQVGFDNALARDTPLFVRFRDSGRSIAGQGRSYRVRSFSYGLAVPALGQLGQLRDCAGSASDRSSAAARRSGGAAPAAGRGMGQCARARRRGRWQDRRHRGAAAGDRCAPHRVSAAGHLPGQRYAAVAARLSAGRSASEPDAHRNCRWHGSLPGRGCAQGAAAVGSGRGCRRLRDRPAHRRREPAGHGVAMERGREVPGD